MPLSQQYGFWLEAVIFLVRTAGVSMPLSQQYGFWLVYGITSAEHNNRLNAALAAIWFLARQNHVLHFMV